MISIIGIFVILSLLFLTRPFTVFIHELGHCLAALFLTRDHVILVIGENNLEKSPLFTFFKLRFYFHYNIFLLNGGLVMHRPTNSKFADVIIALAGPFFSIAFAIILFYFSIFYLVHSPLKYWFFFGAISAILDFIISMYPKIYLHGPQGNQLQASDGQYLSLLFKYRLNPNVIDSAITAYNNHEFNEAIDKFTEINNAGFQNRHINLLFVKSLFHTQQYKKALKLLLTEEKIHLLNFEELNLTGQCYGFLDDIKNSKKYFKKALKVYPHDENLLSNIGFCDLLLGNFHKAIAAFNYVIRTYPENAYSYANKGLALIELGKMKEGLAQIHIAKKINPNEVYAHLNLGIHAFYTENYTDAIMHFRHAHKINPNTYSLGSWIDKCLLKLDKK